MLAIALTLASLAPAAPANCWGPRLSAPVGVAQAQAAAYEWKAHPGSGFQWDLYRGGRQVGGYDSLAGEYRPLLDWARNVWGDVCPAPCELPDPIRDETTGRRLRRPIMPQPIAPKEPEPEQEPTGQLTGVEWSKIRGPDHYTLHGKDVTRRECVQALTRGLVDDSNKPHLTVICSDKGKCDALIKDLQNSPELAPWKDRFRVQAYDPTDKVSAAMLAPLRLDQDKRLQESGLAVYFQAPEKDGKSQVSPIYGYTGPAHLAQALRSVDPMYDPNKNAPPNDGAIDLSSIPPAAWAIGAAVLLLLLAPRKETS